MDRSCIFWYKAKKYCVFSCFGAKVSSCIYPVVFSFVNTAYCRYLGGEAEDIIGRRFTQFIPDEDRKFVQQQFLSLSLDCPIRTCEPT